MYFYVLKRVGTHARSGGVVTRGRPITVRNGTMMPNHPVAEERDERAQVAVYVASMSADLANLARRTGLETLGYLLEIVRLEAENTARNMPGHNGSG